MVKGNKLQNKKARYIFDEKNIKNIDKIDQSDMIDSIQVEMEKITPNKSNKRLIASKYNELDDKIDSNSSESEKISDKEEDEIDSEDKMESDEEEDDDDEDFNQVHNRLLNAIDKFSKQSSVTFPSNSNTGNSLVSKYQNVPENSSSLLTSSMTVSMDALIGALDGSQGLNIVKKKLSEFEKSLNIPTFIEKTTSQRAERSVTYSKTSEDMNKWQDIVTTNRHEKTLDFAQDKRQLPSVKNLITKFQITNDLEKDIQMILFKTSATESQASKMEEDELMARGLSLEEIHMKQAELAKVKARMFYDQMKRHRINKIKSKAFHRIKKRQRQRKEEKELENIQDMDENRVREIMEEKATQRVKERMDLKHKNTGKWAKMALEHGKRDVSLREAYHEAVQLGHNLLEKYDEVIQSKDNISEDDWDSNDSSKNDSDTDSDSDNEGQDRDGRNDCNGNMNKNQSRKQKKSLSQKVSQKVAKALAKVIDNRHGNHNNLNTNKEGEEDNDGPEVDGKYKKLFDMDFMKRATKLKQLRVEDEAKSILRELENMEEMRSDSSDENMDQDTENDNIHSKSSVGATTEGSSSFHTIPRRRIPITRGKVSSSGPMSIDNSNDSNSNSNSNSNNSGNSNSNLSIKRHKKKTIEKKSDQTVQAIDNAVNNESSHPIENMMTTTIDHQIQEEEKVNPWLELKSKKPDQTNKKKKKEGKTSNVSSNIISNTASTSSSTSSSSDKIQSNAITQEKKPQHDRKPLLLQKSQEDLVQMAFAGPNLEEEFAVYKEQTIGDELGFDTKRKEVISKVKAGWGDWAGPGNMLISNKIQSIRDRNLKKIEAEEKAKKEGRKDVKMPHVVISERRVKSAAKYVVGQIPHPFTSREEYEQSMRMPIGEEWNASHVVKEITKPKILMRAGRLIQPIVLPKKRSNPETSGEETTDKPRPVKRIK